MAHDDAKILIVEDDTLVAETLARILKGRNVGFLLAGSIAQAEKFLESSSVDIVILDRMLPDGDGVKLLEKMKAKPALRKVPVLILSGRTAAPDQIAGLDMGADDYMSKPFSVPELKARVDVLLRRAQKFVSPPDEN
ncbi:MAG: response regulator [Elusimicrobiales bacterium]|jgi:DNA-binding response OmpR family regulator